MLYLIGLGLNDEEDMTLKALNTLKQCDKIYAEFYTNVWQGSIEKLEKLIGKKLNVLEREKVESMLLINEAKKKMVALLIPGDPLSATTHYELIALAKQNNVSYHIIHAPSIHTAVAETGLDLYKFGRITTMPLFQKNYQPSSPYQVIESNQKIGYHTLMLLDIKMTITQALEQLLILEQTHNKNIISKATKILACTKLGNDDKKIVYNTIEKLIKQNIKDIPAVIIITGRLNDKEQEYLNLSLL
ncbi:MAG: diphthine synthase [Candidatus Aenigmatarchaeota archaeon]